MKIAVNYVREKLLNETVVVFKKQSTLSGDFTKFVSDIGEIGNYHQMVHNPVTEERIEPMKEFIHPDKWPNKETYPVQRVTGKIINGERTGIFGTGVLDWHANLNAPNRDDGVALQGIKDCEGTSTTWLNLAKAYDEMPQELLDRCKDVYCEYEYSPEVWAGGLPESQLSYMRKNKTTYKMWLLQENAAGKKGIYFYTNNKCKIITDDNKLYDDLYDFTFQEKYMYTHYYEVGDIVLSDQLISLHKRDQNEPEILQKRILHRITFKLSNYGKPTFIEERNRI